MENSPIGWVGGKSRIRKHILERFPKHSIYVEVFCGAAWVLFGKDPSISHVEIINDRHGELINFFRCVREQPLELFEKIKFRLISQEDFHREKGLGASSGSEIERAARFYWLVKVAFGSKLARSSFGYRLDEEKPRFRSDLARGIIERAHERLKRVQIFNEDFERLIQRVDRPKTFSYCDPPYFGHETCYEERFTQEAHERLAKTLKAIKGKFLLSYNDCPEIRRLYDWATIETVENKYSCGTRRESRRKTVTELLIRNYDLSA